MARPLEVELDIEAQLRRFELGESAYVGAIEPLSLEVLNEIGSAFVAHYAQSKDLRYLNAVLKIVHREGFAQAFPAGHRAMDDWAERELAALRKSRGLV
jgi:hypothetical protein